MVTHAQEKYQTHVVSEIQIQNWKMLHLIMLHKNLQVCLFFSINLDDEEDRMGRSKKPIGVKKAKLKRKIDDQTSLVINTLEKKIKNYWRN